MRARSLALALLLLALPACGKRGDPLAPLSRVPQPVTDLKIEQRGRELVYSFTAPRVTVGALRLPVLEIELLRATGEGDFQKLAKRDTRKAAPGETLHETVPLPAPDTVVRVAARALAGKTPSQVTKTVALKVVAAPATPTDLTAVLQPGVVALAWKGVLPPLPSPSPSPSASPSPGANPAPLKPAPPPSPAVSPSAAVPPAPSSSPSPGAPPAAAPKPSPSPSATPTPPPPPKRGFWIYRRTQSDSYGAPLFETPINDNVYKDTTVELGQTVCYVARMVLSTDPVIESESSSEACVGMKDIAPPAAPTGVAILVQPDHVEVSWSPSPESDLKGYKIYRSVGGAKPVLAGEIPAGQTVFRDPSPGKGGATFYTIVAVDTAGNESPPTTPAEGHLP